MHILSVELENIKRYEHGRYEFMLGTNAISGPNGAGKSTIVEAIGYALFDSLPYKKEDFLRRGASTGTVRVTFESSVDQRDYTVVRNTKSTYYVYDPETKTRVAEQKMDVLSWLRHHLGVEPDTDLDEFFRTTIGVPQGTFTSIFMDPATRRKAVFDKILRVEEYRQSSDVLKETANHFQAKIVEAERSLAGLEGRLLRMPDLEVQASQIDTELKSSEARFVGARTELAGWQARLAECDELEKAIAQDQRDLEALETRLSFSRRELEAAQAHFMEAERAADELKSLESQVQAYQQAERDLAALENDRKGHDRLKTERAAVQRRLDEATFAQQSLTERLKALDQDALDFEALKPKVAEQSALETQLQAIKAQASEAKALDERLKRAMLDIETWGKRLEELDRQLLELDPLKEAAAQAQKLFLALSERQEALRKLQEGELKRKELVSRRKVLEEATASQRRAIAAHDRTLAEKAPLQAIADTLDELTEKGQALRDQLATVEAELARDRKSTSEFRGNMCPILNVGCPILEGQSPEAYFRNQIEANEAKAKTLQAAIADLRKRWKEASDASKQVAGLEGIRSQREEAIKLLSSQEADLNAVAQALAALPIADQERRMLEQAIAVDQAALTRAQAEAARYAQRDSLVTQRDAIAQEQGQRQAGIEADRAAQAAFEDLPARLAACEQALAALSDPRSRALALERAIAQRPALEAERAQHEALAAAAQAEFVVSEAKLAPYQDLEARFQDATARKQVAEPAHRKHLAIAPVAADRNARASKRDTAKAQEEALEAERQTVSVRAGERRASYRADEHAGLRERVEGLKTETIRLEQALGFMRQQLEAIQREMAELRRVQTELAEAIAERDRLSSYLSFVEFSRLTLKEAGPFITEAYLMTISLEADRLFREITGLHHVHLRWSSDYEIQLEEGGRDRPFANLSGGEQMVAALAVRLALLKEMSSIDIAFFDEPTTNMDESRRASLALQIGQVQTFKQLFVISHDDSFEQWTDHVVRLDGPANAYA